MLPTFPMCLCAKADGGKVVGRGCPRLMLCGQVRNTKQLLLESVSSANGSCAPAITPIMNPLTYKLIPYFPARQFPFTWRQNEHSEARAIKSGRAKPLGPTSKRLALGFKTAATRIINALSLGYGTAYLWPANVKQLQ